MEALKNLFKEYDPQSFKDTFGSEDQCREFLVNEKWGSGFTCRKCGHTNYCAGKSPYSRRCTRCKAEESATSHTLFHHCKIPLTQAFEIAFMVCNDPGISSYRLAEEFDTRQMTCWKFRRKLQECTGITEQ